MKFTNSYVSGAFLGRLYNALCKSRMLVRSDLYDESFGFSEEDLHEELLVLLLQMEDIASFKD